MNNMEFHIFIFHLGVPDGSLPAYRLTGDGYGDSVSMDSLSIPHGICDKAQVPFLFVFHFGNSFN